MKAVDTNACFMVDEDDLLNFSFDEEDDKFTKYHSSSSFESSNLDTQHPDDHSRSFPELVEEELEWLSNKDAFPAVETCLDILSEHPGIIPSHHSPVSVLENSTSSSNSNGTTITSCFGSLQVPTHYPVRVRSKIKQRRRTVFPDFPNRQCLWWNQAVMKNTKQEYPMPPKPKIASSSIRRRCQHCQSESTPQWRAGPMGPKTLCNACGVRYKSGRLVPEYRPASSPTFSSLLHSNSHRKVMEMRRLKQLGVGGYW